MSKIKVEGLAEAIEQELTLYSRQVNEQIRKEARAAMKQLVDKTIEDAPTGNRQEHYKDHIKSRTIKDELDGVIFQWYVDGPDYRLSHLLNNGHAKVNGGTVPGSNFITNAEKEAIEKYEKAVEEAIRNG